MGAHSLAYVGGIDFRSFKYDMVYQGRRQVGSVIKPFLYSLSMIDGISPCDQILHEPVTLYDATSSLDATQWWVSKARRVGNDQVGTSEFSNWVTAYLMGRTTPKTFERMLRSFGIKGRWES